LTRSALSTMNLRWSMFKMGKAMLMETRRKRSVGVKHQGQKITKERRREEMEALFVLFLSASWSLWSWCSIYPLRDSASPR
jgi:hypothetical protein